MLSNIYRCNLVFPINIKKKVVMRGIPFTYERIMRYFELDLIYGVLMVKSPIPFHLP